MGSFIILKYWVRMGSLIILKILGICGISDHPKNIKYVWDLLSS